MLQIQGDCLYTKLVHAFGKDLCHGSRLTGADPPYINKACILLLFSFIDLA